MTNPARWEPDGQLVAAVLSTPRAARTMADLDDPDRAWVVAGLTLAGLTAKDIAERLSCSLRLIRSIRAEPMTQICYLMQIEARNFTDELRLERSEHQATRQTLAQTASARDRYKRQLDNLLDKLVVGEKIETCYRGHPLDGDNRYRHGHRVYCRACNRENTIAYRKRKRAEQQCHSVRVSQPVHAESVASA